MASALSEILAVLAPPSCAACRRTLPAADALVCGPCLAALPWLRGPRCVRCGLPDHAAGGCGARRAPYAVAWAPVAYEGVARDLVWALKFGRVLSVADLLGAQVVANLPRDLRGLP